MDPHYGRDFTLAHGWLYPERNAAKKIVAKLRSRDATLVPVLRHCRARNTVVQAGGHCGMWADGLASYGFRTVYTFEPDHRNFTALVYNLKGWPEVVPYRAALGAGRATVDMKPGTGMNSGGMHVSPMPAPSGDGVKSMLVDDIGLKALDLLMLDVEGMEKDALIGAMKSIRTFKPVIVLEQSGLGKRYGWTETEAATLLATEGYREAERVGRHDVVYVWDDPL